MNEHVSPGLLVFSVHNNSDVRDVSSQIPSDQVSGRIVANLVTNRQELALALKENHKIWDSSVINI